MDTYLGWEEPGHMDGCRRPAWDVSLRREDQVYRQTWPGGEPPLQHACPEEDCAHSNRFDRVSVRLVCRSCGAARIVTGEETEETGQTLTSTKHLGYGLAPRQAAGLRLWPAEPWLSAGRAVSSEPHDFVVTRLTVKKPTADTVLGQIMQGRGKQGGLIWTALAVLSPDGPFGYGDYRWAYCNDGHDVRGGRVLRTVAGAASWISARLAEHEAATAGAAAAAGGAQ
ncbi:hypothetical protein AB0G64_09270 [Streptomyces longwoodensis]|uniref:hypothetical protein n=1 Tax=Streptomyces longwoodensis TaxID=68231 RepID=UPI0033C7BEFC